MKINRISKIETYPSNLNSNLNKTHTQNIYQ